MNVNVMGREHVLEKVGAKAQLDLKEHRPKLITPMTLKTIHTNGIHKMMTAMKMQYGIWTVSMVTPGATILQQVNCGKPPMVKNGLWMKMKWREIHLKTIWNSVIQKIQQPLALHMA